MSTTPRCSRSTTWGSASATWSTRRPPTPRSRSSSSTAATHNASALRSPMPANAFACRAAASSDRARNSAARADAASRLQKLIRGVDRAERDAERAEMLDGAFEAIDHGDDERDAGAVCAGSFERAGRRAAGRGDVLQDDNVAAGEALRRALDAPLGAVVLHVGAHEEARDRPAAVMACHGDRRDERHGADRKAADEVDRGAVELVEDQLGDPGGACRIEHGGLHVEVEIALAPGCQHDLAAAE